MHSLLEQSVFFGVAVSIAAYEAGSLLKKKYHSALFNPLLLSVAATIVLLILFRIDYDTYYEGAKYLSYLLTPATVCLAIPMYEQLELLKKNLKAVMVGILSGVLMSLGCILVMAIVFGLNHETYVTLLPKSITTAIGMGVSEELGGYVTITVATIVITGVLGNIIGESLCKLFHIEEPIAKGVALGTASHAIGTARAMEMGEIEGAMDAFNVAGRGEMSLSILIETMRREGYEFQVSPPRVLYQMIDGKKCEPIERLVCDVPQEYVGAVIEKLGSRKGDLAEMTPIGSRMKLEFLIPARGLFGYRNEFLTDTKGEGIMASVFDSYAPYKGELARRNTGSLVASETGTSITYGLFNAQERGVLFIGAGVDVYEGMVVGQSPKQEDITVNVCKKKQLTNMRASGSDDALRLVPPKQMSLEQCLEFLADDELLEVTPKNLRIRKTILNKELRMKATHGNKKVLQ